jgi:hypothetical protein
LTSLLQELKWSTSIIFIFSLHLFEWSINLICSVRKTAFKAVNCLERVITCNLCGGSKDVYDLISSLKKNVFIWLKFLNLWKALLTQMHRQKIRLPNERRWKIYFMAHYIERVLYAIFYCALNLVYSQCWAGSWSVIRKNDPIRKKKNGSPIHDPWIGIRNFPKNDPIRKIKKRIVDPWSNP